MSYPFADPSGTPHDRLLSLAGRSAVVTGGAQGLGKAIAVRLAGAGANVVIGDLNGDRAREVAAELSERFSIQASGTVMDVTRAESVAAAAAFAVAENGSIDIWVNNAGVFPSVPALDMTDERWDDVFAVNARGVFIGSREAARGMAESGGGVIVNIASTAGFRGTAPGLSAYVSSKHAVRGMTKQMALEFAPLGIRVLGVAPTFVPTEGNLAAAAAAAAAAGAAAGAVQAGDAPADEMAVMTNSLIGRLGTPDDIARVVLFCASDASMIMTGSTLLADAGQTI